jgi:hypothetical protein
MHYILEIIWNVCRAELTVRYIWSSSWSMVNDCGSIGQRSRHLPPQSMRIYCKENQKLPSCLAFPFERDQRERERDGGLGLRLFNRRLTETEHT